MKNGNKIQKKSEKKQGWIGDDAGRALFSGSNVHFQIWKHLHFLMKNRHKIGEKSEKKWEWWSVLLGDAFRVQGRCPKREISVVFDPQVRKTKIMMIIPIRVQPIGDWGVVT